MLFLFSYIFILQKLQFKKEFSVAMSQTLKPYRRFFIFEEKNVLDTFVVGPFADQEATPDWVDAMVALTVPDIDIRWEVATEVGRGEVVYPSTMTPSEVLARRETEW